MLKLGLAPDIIQQSTGLTEPEIAALGKPEGQA